MRKLSKIKHKLAAKRNAKQNQGLSRVIEVTLTPQFRCILNLKIVEIIYSNENNDLNEVLIRWITSTMKVYFKNKNVCVADAPQHCAEVFVPETEQVLCTQNLKIHNKKYVWRTASYCDIKDVK